MKTLFDTTHIGNMTLKNRFIRAAIGEKTTKEHVNENVLDLYKNRLFCYGKSIGKRT
jgi:2,4-dienoyl-CoA reductase-like NADH-dependent reductase (Old Yellow Enzyme family)